MLSDLTLSIVLIIAATALGTCMVMLLKWLLWPPTIQYDNARDPLWFTREVAPDQFIYTDVTTEWTSEPSASDPKRLSSGRK